MAPTQRLPPVKRFIAIRVVPAFTILIGVSAIALGLQTTRLARESRTWPTVDGEIVASEIVEDAQAGVRTTPTNVTHRPVVRYRYRTGGTDYTGERVAFGEYATNERTDAEAVIQRYPIGRRVPVHVRPNAPDTSVLEAGDHGLPWFYLVLGAAFLLAGLLLAWLAPKLIAPA